MGDGLVSARPYRVTWTWQDGKKGRLSFATRKAAETCRTELLATAEGLRDGSLLLATSNGQPIPATAGEVLEYDEARRTWVKKLPAAAVTVRITKRRALR